MDLLKEISKLLDETSMNDDDELMCTLCCCSESGGNSTKTDLPKHTS